MTGLIALALLAPQTNWKLVWSDEFDKPGLPDPAKWSYETGYERNDEKQFYTEKRLENARVEKGKLVIECRKDNFDGKPITSASLVTWKKAGWLYGRIEVKAKIPTGKGSWPAIWMMGTDRDKVGWPKCGEIDIMENVGFAPDNIHATCHYPGPDGKHRMNGTKIETKRPYGGFHVYAVDWFPDRLDFYYDDQKYFTFKNDGSVDGWKFDKECYLLINLAFGGSWGGSQGIDESIFPLKYEIEYVRVYQKK